MLFKKPFAFLNRHFLVLSVHFQLDQSPLQPGNKKCGFKKLQESCKPDLKSCKNRASWIQNFKKSCKNLAKSMYSLAR